MIVKSGFNDSSAVSLTRGSRMQPFLRPLRRQMCMGAPEQYEPHIVMRLVVFVYRELEALRCADLDRS